MGRLQANFGVVILLLVSGQVGAALFDRGNGLIYDDVFDITWMQDADVARQTSPGSDSFSSTLTWAEAVSWADNLELGGHDKWRLPNTPQPDLTCERQNQFGSSGLGCTGSELGHLFNVYGVRPDNPGPFVNILPASYWSGSVNPLVPGEAFFLAIGTDGFQGSVPFDRELHAWAVHDGDIGVIPIPATVWLFVTGLIALVGTSWCTNAD